MKVLVFYDITAQCQISFTHMASFSSWSTDTLILEVEKYRNCPPLPWCVWMENTARHRPLSVTASTTAKQAFRLGLQFFWSPSECQHSSQIAARSPNTLLFRMVLSSWAWTLSSKFHFCFLPELCPFFFFLLLTLADIIGGWEDMIETCPSADVYLRTCESHADFRAMIFTPTITLLNASSVLTMTMSTKHITLLGFPPQRSPLVRPLTPRFSSLTLVVSRINESRSNGQFFWLTDKVQIKKLLRKF